MLMPEITVDAMHPGLILQQELDKRGLSQKDFAFMASRPIKTINEICLGKASISTKSACDIELLTGINALYWLQKQAAYDLSIERKRYKNKLKPKPEKQKKAPETKANKVKDEILSKLKQGKGFNEIASELNLKYNTVYFAVKRWEKENGA